MVCGGPQLCPFKPATTQVEHGWMNDSALSLIDLMKMSLAATVLLDEPQQGAANPWAVAWTKDGRWLGVTHAGTHELSLVDAPALLERLADRAKGAVVDDLAFLHGIRERIAPKGNGPRALALGEDKAYVAEFFSDTISVVDLRNNAPVAVIRLGSSQAEDPKRQGERLFHDATLSHQSWQSCAICHPDRRADGLNWDLVNGKLSPAAQRGKRLLFDAQVSCGECHRPGLFTDLKSHDVGTAGKRDDRDRKFDTPTLIECWRTAPYLHDGSAVTILDVLKTFNRHDQHGQTSHLTKEQIDDLAAYVL
jgi:mono/diheme cytochrome c family protein